MTYSRLKQRYAIPRVSTRGYFDLRTGELKEGKDMFGYFLYPKYKFENILQAPEIVIFVHGMRNSRKGSVMGTNTLRRKLRKLGYKYPVIGFTYDADVRGAHLEKNYIKVLRTAYKIAGDNGEHLSKYIEDLLNKKPSIKIHLVGHSLGCEVILHAIFRFNVCSKHETHVSSIHLFGSPLECNDLEISCDTYNIINYFNPTDEVIQEGVIKGELKKPSCLVKPTNIKSKRCYAKDHAFKSYTEKLRSFP